MFTLPLAYLDPGTMQNAFGVLAPLLAGLAAAVGFLVHPLRSLIARGRARYGDLSRPVRVSAWLVLAGLVLLAALGGAVVLAGG
ncbi:MAG: hypothetical protein ACOC46_01900 [Pirellulales bacterium]